MDAHNPVTLINDVKEENNNVTAIVYKLPHLLSIQLGIIQFLLQLLHDVPL
jgi:hypothetical protein